MINILKVFEAPLLSKGGPTILGNYGTSYCCNGESNGGSEHCCNAPGQEFD